MCFNFQVYILVPLTTVRELKCVISMKIIYITESRHIILNFHCNLTHTIDCIDWLRIKEQTRFITLSYIAVADSVLMNTKYIVLRSSYFALN